MANLAYIRVSTDPQSTARQEAIIGKYNVERIFTEKMSGKSMNRPQLAALLDFMRAGDTVYIESYSRLGRSTRDLLNLFQKFKDKDVTLVSEKENLDTSTPHGKLMMTIFASLAEFERDLTLQRVREGMEAARKKGRIGGRPKVKRPSDFLEVVKLQESGALTVDQAVSRLGITRTKYFEFKQDLKKKGHGKK